MPIRNLVDLVNPFLSKPYLIGPLIIPMLSQPRTAKPNLPTNIGQPIFIDGDPLLFQIMFEYLYLHIVRQA